jgi:rhodanese-related sulfurtransferase
MKLKIWRACVTLFPLLAMILTDGGLSRVQAFNQSRVDQPTSPRIEFITADELKVKIARNDPVTIIDVRSSSAFSESDDKIKGAVRAKLRRLKSRLAFPPLKNVPRESEVVTYCACPSDEASTRAAQILLTAGFKRVRVLKNGWQAWLKVNGQVQPRPRPT